MELNGKQNEKRHLDAHLYSLDDATHIVRTKLLS